jgi:hypothetical protein
MLQSAQMGKADVTKIGLKIIPFGKNPKHVPIWQILKC